MLSTDPFRFGMAEVLAFAGNNREAGELYSSATEDYVAARCCILNGLFSGFPLGAQAVEKMLKAFILYKAPATKVRDMSHYIDVLAKEAGRLGCDVISRHEQRIARLME